MSTEPVLRPKQLPSDTHEVIVVTESLHVGWEDVSFSKKTHEALVYHNTIPGQDDIAARIKDASIIVCTICKLSGEDLAKAPYLKCIVSHPVGTDHIDIEYCRQHNIQVMNCTGCNTETVAEHALSLYFATRRTIVSVHNVINNFSPGQPNEWKAKGSLIPHMLDATGKRPRTCRQEIAGIIGYGAVGKQIASLCTSLGMQVIISDRKNGPSTSTATTTGLARVPFQKVLETASVIFLTLPLLPSTRSLFSSSEFLSTSPHTILINMSRGGIVDESAVLAALQSRDHLYGYGTDVFATEPAGNAEDSVLLGEGARGLNLVVTGHQAWVSETTLANQKRRVGQNLKRFVEEEEGMEDVIVPRKRV